MHGPINVKSPNNTSKWQIEFNTAFKGLKLVEHVALTEEVKIKSTHVEGKSFYISLGKPMTLKYNLKRYTNEIDCKGASFTKWAVA
jgi:hypothetical protein